MSVKLLQTLFIIIAFTALIFVAMEIVYIGNVFEEKSFYSYQLKTGDTDPRSSGVITHTQGVAAYGRTIGIRVALGSAIFGLLMGFLTARWWLSKNSSQTLFGSDYKPSSD